MSYKSTLNCLKFSSLALFLLFLQPAFAQGKKKNEKEIGIERFADLDNVVTHYQKQLGNNLVAMAWTDTLVYKRELGEFDVKTAVPVEAASKWFTAALIMQLVDEGKLSLEDKVSQFIPIYGLYGKNYITIRHCLSNMTGIQAENGMFSKKNFASLEEEVASYAKKEIQTNPGTEFRYNDLGTNIAGRIAEIVTKKKFDMLIKTRLFKPLQMTKTSFSTLDGSAPDPANGAVATATDFMHFLQMLLDNGKYNGVQVLSENAVKELRKVQIRPEVMKYAPKQSEGFTYALGSWVVDGENEATALTGSALNGTWPVVDWCHGYAFLVLVKTRNPEPKKELYLQLKDALDEKLRSKCN